MKFFLLERYSLRSHRSFGFIRLRRFLYKNAQFKKIKVDACSLRSHASKKKNSIEIEDFLFKNAVNTTLENP